MKYQDFRSLFHTIALIAAVLVKIVVFIDSVLPEAAL